MYIYFLEIKIAGNDLKIVKWSNLLDFFKNKTLNIFNE